MIEHATFVATLAEKFNLTSFKPFQKDIIKAVLDRKDILLLFTQLAVAKVFVFYFHQYIKSKKQSSLLLQSV